MQEESKKPLRINSKPIHSPQNYWAERMDQVAYVMELAFEWLGTKLAYIMSMVVGLGFWYIGAYFTVYGLRGIFPFLLMLKVWIWLIPIGVSTIELRFWKEADPLHRFIWLFVTFIDVSTTLFGALSWASGRSLNIGAGIDLPLAGFWLVAPMTVFSVLLTFLPERIIIWAWRKITGY